MKVGDRVQLSEKGRKAFPDRAGKNWSDREGVINHIPKRGYNVGTASIQWDGNRAGYAIHMSYLELVQ